MEFGVIFEMQELYPWDEESHSRSYWQSIEQARVAEEAGFDAVWCVEHHFLNQFSLSPAPEVFLAAVAQHTKRVRIGHGVVLLPFNYNHPIRVAERAAVLDILSNGRLELGTGRSASLLEFGGFGIQPDVSRAQWDEAIHMIPKMWMESDFAWESELITVPPRSIVPKPVQKPHPPLWMAGLQPASAELAGERGLGFLHFSFTEPELLGEKVQVYRDAIERANPVGGYVHNKFAGFTIGFCGETDAEARRLGEDGARWYVGKSHELYSVWSGSEAETYQWYRESFNAERETDPEKIDMDRLIKTGAVCLGSPETCRNAVGVYADQGIDHLIVLMQVGRTKHQDILDSTRRFGQEVIPHFRSHGKKSRAGRGAA